MMNNVNEIYFPQAKDNKKVKNKESKSYLKSW
jgi:hypothetical protein